MDDLEKWFKAGKFDKFLEGANELMTLDQRKKVNKVGNEIYEKAMQTFLDAHKRDVVYKDGTQHLADTLTHEIKEDGHYEGTVPCQVYTLNNKN